MKCGNIICSCGQSFYFETEMESVRCLQCGAKFDTAQYPDKVEEVVQSITTTGKVEDWDVDPAALV